MDEFNNASTEVLNTLYEISHPQKKKHTRVPYKKGKHSIYAPDKYSIKDLMYKENILIFGKSGIGKCTTIQNYIENKRG